MGLAQGHNTGTPVRLELAAPQIRVMHSIIDPLVGGKKVSCSGIIVMMFMSAGP